MRTEWLLCPAAHEEAQRTGMVYACGIGRPGHVCDGPLTPYLWDARGVGGAPFKSKQPCCSSCISDEWEGHSALRGHGEACCCVHGTEKGCPDA